MENLYKWAPSLALLLLGCGSLPGARSAAADEAAAEVQAASGRGARPGAAPAGEAGAGPWRRRELVAEALRRAPGLRALAARARARVEEARGAEALPPPMAMAQLWQAPLRSPFVYGEGTMLMVGMQQSFTPGGARRAEAQGMAEEARMLAAELSVRERELATQVSVLAVELRFAREQAGQHRGHRELLGQAAGAVRAKQAAVGGGLLDLPRFEREIAAREVEEEEAQGEEKRAQGELNALLGRPADAPLLLADEGEWGLPTESAAQLQARARERNPEALVAAAARRRDAARAEAAGQMGRSPMYTVGVNYGLMRDHGEAAHTWGATFSMSLPWLSPGGAALGRARAEEAAASRLEQDGVLQRLDREVAASHARATAAARRLSVVEGKALPAARRALEAQQAGFATSATDAASWLEALHELREVEVARARARSELARAVLELERAVGEEIALAPAAEVKP